MNIHSAITWVVSHPDTALGVAAVVIALLRAFYALLYKVLAPYPRVRSAVEAVAAAGPDVATSILHLYGVVTGRPPPNLDLDAKDAEIAQLRNRVAELAATQVVNVPNVAPSGQV